MAPAYPGPVQDVVRQAVDRDRARAGGGPSLTGGSTYLVEPTFVGLRERVASSRSRSLPGYQPCGTDFEPGVERWAINSAVRSSSILPLSASAVRARRIGEGPPSIADGLDRRHGEADAVRRRRRRGSPRPPGGGARVVLRRKSDPIPLQRDDLGTDGRCPLGDGTTVREATRGARDQHAAVVPERSGIPVRHGHRRKAWVGATRCAMKLRSSASLRCSSVTCASSPKGQARSRRPGSRCRASIRCA
ncbi:hypothetical protein MPOCJGCO_4385 [Methylobacterium trifolii]|uniref:Uncharacterized protein n=1 Tax=Methylobacterium trifolii TaxID=1003092 RepID=A0ABQ4U5Q4_9HYPH|nr:hypothetical protein MPOCJGCO_4385 [Methylobacterium trifolii]